MNKKDTPKQRTSIILHIEVNIFGQRKYVYSRTLSPR